MTLPDGLTVENWTGHDIKLVDKATGEDWLIRPEPGAPVRLEVRRRRLSRFIIETAFGAPRNLPLERPDVRLIVSSPVKIALSFSRHDLITPADLIRDSRGNVVACQSFAT